GPGGRRTGRKDRRHRHAGADRAQRPVSHRPLSRPLPWKREWPDETPRERRGQSRRHHPGEIERGETAIERGLMRAPCFFLMAALCALSAMELMAQAPQDTPSKTPQGKTQKVRNPLNDLLDEAQAAL